MGILIFMSYHYLTDILPMWVNFILTGIEGLLLYVIIMVLLKGLNKNDGASMPLIGKIFLDNYIKPRGLTHLSQSSFLYYLYRYYFIEKFLYHQKHQVVHLNLVLSYYSLFYFSYYPHIVSYL